MRRPDRLELQKPHPPRKKRKIKTCSSVTEKVGGKEMEGPAFLTASLDPKE